MQQALARVQAAHSTWTRADLMREMADCMPPEAHQMEPAAVVALLHDMTDRAIAGEAEQVVCLDAPEWPPTPEYLRRELDGRSEYTQARDLQVRHAGAAVARGESSWPPPGGRQPRT